MPSGNPLLGATESRMSASGVNPLTRVLVRVGRPRTSARTEGRVALGRLDEASLIEE